MDENPYRSPASPPRYYTDGLILMPVTVIWRIMRQQSLLAAVVQVPLLLLRKALGWRLPAHFGTLRIDELRLSGEEEAPAHVREAFVPFAEACRQQGMDLVGYFRHAWIGSRTGIAALWLERGGAINATASWLEFRVGTVRLQKTVLECHTKLSSGVDLHTAAVAPEDWTPEIFPPNHEVLILEPSLSPSQVIDRHRARITGRDDVIRFDAEAVRQDNLHSIQEYFDFMVAKGFYAPLTPAEVDRLMSGEAG